ncbi:LANO_0H21660g1_1 [Lachancea nothofagi CBS 11611]|uniref:LANO_0H21660g1_1 n=1 Tax=Lachancea nothofagi CBS 11611 TaxID=1266666 RepID=A0A1G4KNS6_9SACH|nr:LANO_0H21660g1_1 [Lachancea nothofagi CBS 11611]
MSYSQYASFLENEIRLLRNLNVREIARLDELGTHTSDSLQERLQQELTKRHQEVFKTLNQDDVLLKVQEQEQTVLREELHRVMALVGDLPKDKIGSDIIDLQEAQDGKFVSIQQLMTDIDNLPQISLMDTEDLENEPLLSEYNKLRDGLRDKVKAIRDAEKSLPQLRRPLDQFRSLENAVDRQFGDTTKYFETYQENVIAQAQETAKLVEVVLKKNGKLPQSSMDGLKEIITMMEAMK